MITVKFVGGAKKCFQTDRLELDLDGISIEQLLVELQKIKPTETPNLDTNNILIAINGIDSSTLSGRTTKLVNNDTVSLIPVIHGGIDYIHFKSHAKNVRIYEIKGSYNIGSNFLDKLRIQFPKLKLQAISKKFVLNSLHLKEIISLSLDFEKNNLLMSNKLETDMLMRFVLKEQISDAIKVGGIKENQNFILIVIGNMQNIKKLHNYLNDQKTDISFNSPATVKKQFQISNNQINSIYSKTPLEDLLVEKASILLRNTPF